jgi:hypothetical protein
VGGGGNGGNGGGGNGGGNGGGGNDKGAGGGNGGPRAGNSGLPGKSADHNPHGGPPAKIGLTPAHGDGLSPDKAADAAKAAKPGHAHKH